MRKITDRRMRVGRQTPNGGVMISIRLDRCWADSLYVPPSQCHQKPWAGDDLGLCGDHREQIL